MSNNDRKFNNRKINNRTINEDIIFTSSVNNDTEENDIFVELPEVKKGEKTTVHYNGILNNSGAERVYLHYGFDGWNNTSTIPMKKTHEGCYSMEIDVKGKDEVNFCFKDSANNWDNNSGSDWKVGITSR